MPGNSLVLGVLLALALLAFAGAGCVEADRTDADSGSALVDGTQSDGLSFIDGQVDPAQDSVPVDGGGESDDSGGGASSDSSGSSADHGPQSCPAHHKRVGGTCLPSCGTAGGNTCTSSATTLCLGLPQLTSHDCQVCCARPSYPTIGPSGFHTITAAKLTTWDAILALSSSHAGQLIAAQNQPPGVSANRWAKNIHTSHYATPEAMADAMHLTFVKGGGAPLAMLIDEVKTSTEGYIKTVADRMRTVYPQWKGRWGAYLVNGTAVAYPNLATGIDALLQADAIIAVELYPYLTDYCSSGTTTAARDKWLGDFFHGSRGAFPQGRFHWLAQRRAAKGSASHLTVVFGVTDKFVGGSGAAKLIDRMFYVWITRSGYPSIISLQGGGPGAWKWDGPYVSSTSRDLAFAQSFEHYVVQGKISSRLGPVSCP